jgi:hypothetical protein
MGREIVYCWKCALRLRGEDFDEELAYRVGDKVSCPDCIDELIADLSAEAQEAILHPSRKKSTSQSVKKITSTSLKPVYLFAEDHDRGDDHKTPLHFTKRILDITLFKVVDDELHPGKFGMLVVKQNKLQFIVYYLSFVTM